MIYRILAVKHDRWRVKSKGFLKCFYSPHLIYQVKFVTLLLILIGVLYNNQIFFKSLIIRCGYFTCSISNKGVNLI
mgnify:CR=1 FL=1